MKKIKVLKNGPYHVTKDLRLVKEAIRVNELGESSHWEKTKDYGPFEEDYYLCRCGQSKDQPFCDGSHERLGFDGEETASFESYNDQAESFTGSRLVLKDQEDLCVHARFCTKGLGTYGLVEKSSKEENYQEAKNQVRSCPSGRLTLEDMEARSLEEDYEMEVSFTFDPVKNHMGGLWVKGGVEIEASDGRLYEKRNRVSLCKCGDSKNKPFCDGSHYHLDHMKIDKDK